MTRQTCVKRLIKTRCAILATVLNYRNITILTGRITFLATKPDDVGVGVLREHLEPATWIAHFIQPIRPIARTPVEVRNWHHGTSVAIKVLHSCTDRSVALLRVVLERIGMRRMPEEYCGRNQNNGCE